MKRSSGLKRTGFTKKPAKKRVVRKTVNKGYVAPAWFNKIKLGSHGSTPAQKRYWKATSDFVRERDFKKYKGKCVSCNTFLADWRDGDCAHFKKYSVCNSWFKFDHRNLALSCKSCNHRDDGVVGHRFGEEMKRRHGDDYVDMIEYQNELYRGMKMEVWEIVEKVKAMGYGE